MCLRALSLVLKRVHFSCLLLIILYFPLVIAVSIVKLLSLTVLIFRFYFPCVQRSNRQLSQTGSRVKMLKTLLSTQYVYHVKIQWARVYDTSENRLILPFCHQITTLRRRPRSKHSFDATTKIDSHQKQSIVNMSKNVANHYWYSVEVCVNLPKTCEIIKY